MQITPDRPFQTSLTHLRLDDPMGGRVGDCKVCRCTCRLLPGFTNKSAVDHDVLTLLDADWRFC